MELALKNLLEESSLHQDVVAHVEKLGIRKMGNFATWVADATEISRFVRGFEFKDDEDLKDSSIAGLRLAWLQAKAQLDHGLKRKASGLQEEVAETGIAWDCLSRRLAPSSWRRLPIVRTA